MNRSPFKFLFSVALFAMVFSVQAEDPPANALHLFLNFNQSKGLMDYYSSDNIPDEYAREMNNVDWSLNGGLHSRRGIQWYYTPSPAQETNMSIQYFWVHTSTTNNKYFFNRLHGDFYSGWFRSLPFPDDLSPIPSHGWDCRIDYLNSNGLAFFVSETTGMYKVFEKVPGTLIFQIVPQGPRGYIAKTHLDRMVVAGSTNPSDAMTVFFSSANDYEQWPAENFVDLNSESGQEKITCIGDQIFGNLPIYTNKTTRLVTGTEYPDADNDSPGNITVKTISNTIGCADQRAVKTLRNKQYFYSDGQGGNYPGIYEFNGVTVKEKTIPYRRFFKDFVVNSSTAPGASPIAFTWKDSYCVLVATINGALTGSGDILGFVPTTDAQICIDENDRITFSGASRVGGFDIDGSTGYFINNLLRGGGNHGVYVYDVAGSTLDLRQDLVQLPISWKYKTKDFGMTNQNNVRAKVPERLYIKHSKNPGIMTVRANYDFGTSSTTWTIDTSSFYKTGDKLTVMTSSDNIINRLRFPSSTRFRYVNFELFGASQAAVDFLDFFATPESLP